MKCHWRLVALVLASLGQLQNVLRAGEMTAEEQAIRNSAKEFVDAYDHGNGEAVAAQWTTDGEYIIGPRSVKGRAAIARLYGEFLRAHPGSKMEVKIESVRVLAPTVAIEQGTAAVRNSANGPPSSSAYTAVHVKQGEKWLMANVRESEIPMSAGEDLADLGWLVGAWAAEGDAAKVEMNYQWMANKHFLRGEIRATANGGSTSGGTQIIGKDPQSGRIVSWFFNADGGHGYGEWSRAGGRWTINTLGMSAGGAPTSATNVLYHASNAVASWQSVNRAIGDVRLPDAREVVIERVSSDK
jgi:uncharacterized protein (TIGR02246 family)